jgi:hypothetical protein
MIKLDDRLKGSLPLISEVAKCRTYEDLVARIHNVKRGQTGLDDSISKVF